MTHMQYTYGEGWRAYFKGITVCPYVHNTRRRAVWLVGNAAAKRYAEKVRKGEGHARTVKTLTTA